VEKIVVTGHKGYIGSMLTSLLVEEGYDVIGIDVNYFGKDCEFFEPKYGKIKEISKDIRDLSEKDIRGSYAICHLAALSNDPLGELSEDLTYDINYRATVRLAILAKRVGVEKFIYSSSCSLYGIGGNAALSEEAEFNPITAYAKSKVYSERDIRPLGDSDFCVTFLRNSTAYGISPKLRVDLVVNNLVGWAVVTGQIKILSDGTPWRPLIHVEDIARAFIAAIETPKDIINQQAFNVGINTENYQIRTIAYMIQNVIPNCNIEITNDHGSDFRTYRVNFDKIGKLMPNFRPRWNLQAGIEQIYKNYKDYNMDLEKFTGRYFIRLKQIKYLMKKKIVDEKLRILPKPL
jgi:nucleoside-diphosphate-sugar epimerase